MADLTKDKPLDKSAHQQIGDDKGEGGQRDIKTDSVETSQAGARDAPSPAGPGGHEGSAPLLPEDKASAGETPGQRQQGDEDLDEDSKSTIDNQGLK
jgi:hypothetical protein